MALLTVDFHTKSLARRTKMDVFIPSLNLGGCLKNQDVNYYQNNNEKYPLVIFLHGFGDNEKAWQMNTQILKLCEDYKNILVVCIKIPDQNNIVTFKYLWAKKDEKRFVY